MDGSSVRLKVRGEGILAKLLSGILAGGRPASGSGWGQRDEDFDPISRQGFLVKLASRGPCREWILAGTAQMAAGSFAFSGGLSPICDMQGGWSVLGTPGLRDTWATKAAGPQAQPGPPWIPHCDSSHEVQHRRSLLRMFSYQHRNLPPTEVKNDPPMLLGVDRTEPTGPRTWLRPVCVSVGPAMALGGCQGGQFGKSPVQTLLRDHNPNVDRGRSDGKPGLVGDVWGVCMPLFSPLPGWGAEAARGSQGHPRS